MSITQQREKIAPAFPGEQFPYTVQQFREAICLSDRRSRAFIRNNFELETDYKVIGKNHKMVLTEKCLTLAVILRFKFCNFPELVNRAMIPHYTVYQQETIDAVALYKARKLAKKRLLNTSIEYPRQLPIDFSQC